MLSRLLCPLLRGLWSAFLPWRGQRAAATGRGGRDLGERAGLPPTSRGGCLPGRRHQPDPDFFANSEATRNLLEPFLARETRRLGRRSFCCAFTLTRLVLDLGSQSYGRGEVTLTHRGDSLISSRRLRPDGTVDDGGVAYAPIPEETITVTQRNRGTLWTAYVQGGRRFLILSDPLELSIPLLGGVALARVTEDGKPYAFGLRTEVGVSLGYRLTETLLLNLNGSLHALATLNPQDNDDASRRQAQTQGSTASTVFSTLLGAGAWVGVVFQIR